MGDELITIEDLLGDNEASTVEGGVPTVAYGRNFNRPSYFVGDDPEGNLKTRDQYIGDWNKANPMPEAPTPVVAKQEEQPTYEELLRAYEQQPQEKSEKAKRASLVISGVGDMISAVANLVGAYNSGVYAAPKSTLSEAMQARYDKIEAAQKEDREKYRAMLLKRAQMQQRDYLAKQKANDAAAASTNKANATAYENAVKARNSQLNTELAGLAREGAKRQTQANADRAYDQREFWNNKNYGQRESHFNAPTRTTTTTNTQVIDKYTGEPMFKTYPEDHPKAGQFMLDRKGNKIPLTKVDTTTRTTRKV